MCKSGVKLWDWPGSPVVSHVGHSLKLDPMRHTMEILPSCTEIYCDLGRLSWRNQVGGGV